MGEQITLKSPFDGFELSAYHARPTDARRGGLLLIQEIFGVTEHIRELADAFAADGYETIAPSFYDRLEPGFQADYSQAAIAKGVEYSQGTPWDQVAGDAQAAIDALKPPVIAAGFCWGGAATWLAACRCTGLSAAASFYGRRISELKDETPQVPTILHFGKTDASIPPERVEEVHAEAFAKLTSEQRRILHEHLTGPLGTRTRSSVQRRLRRRLRLLISTRAAA